MDLIHQILLTGKDYFDEGRDYYAEGVNSRQNSFIDSHFRAHRLEHAVRDLIKYNHLDRFDTVTNIILNFAIICHYEEIA